MDKVKKELEELAKDLKERIKNNKHGALINLLQIYERVKEILKKV